MSPVSRESSPAFRYYSGLVGAWSGAYTFAVTDSNGLVGLASAARLRVRAMDLTARLLGPSVMATTLALLDAEPRGEGTDATILAAFRHTTRVAKAGVTFFVTEEDIRLGADGASLRMSGTMRSKGARPETYEATGEVDASATRALYRVPWFGVELVQRTEVVAEGLSLTQETAWMKAGVLLRPAVTP